MRIMQIPIWHTGSSSKDINSLRPYVLYHMPLRVLHVNLKNMKEETSKMPYVFEAG